MKKLKARPLAVGDRVGIVAPAGPVRESQALEQASAILTGYGYQVVMSSGTQPRAGYLAGSDLERLIDLERLWLDESVAAIWCLRGGYGTLRLLTGLSYRSFAQQPKILVGFSDITALELALWARIKLVTFHGPVLTTLNPGFSCFHALEMLSGKTANVILDQPTGTRVISLYPGRAKGILLGGNLTTLVSLLGTPYFPDLESKLLFIEEIGEAAYRVDRMLTQLRLSGILNSVAGIMIGRSVPVPQEDEAGLVDVFRERLVDLKIPAAYGLPIGHLEHQWTLPQGIRAEFDANTGELKLCESAFST